MACAKNRRVSASAPGGIGPAGIVVCLPRVAVQGAQLEPISVWFADTPHRCGSYFSRWTGRRASERKGPTSCESPLGCGCVDRLGSPLLRYGTLYGMLYGGLPVKVPSNRRFLSDTSPALRAYARAPKPER